MKHENGPWRNDDGLLVNMYGGASVNAYDLAAVVDLDCGVVIKNGEEKMCTDYMMIYTTRISQLFPEDVQNIAIIRFNEHRNLSPDEVCTFINYLNNHIGPEKMKKMLREESIEALKIELERLAKVGF